MDKSFIKVQPGVNVYDFFESMSTSTVDIDRRPIFFGMTSTVDIDRFWPIFEWNRRSIKYRPYFQIGDVEFLPLFHTTPVSISLLQNSFALAFWRHFTVVCRIRTRWLHRGGTLVACARVNACRSRNVYTPCTLRRSKCSVCKVGNVYKKSSAWRQIQCSEDLQLQNVPHEQLVRARVSNNASDPSPRSYNKHLRLVSFALLLLFVQFQSDPNLEDRPLIMFVTDAKIRVSKIFGAKNGPKINFFRKKSPNVAFFNKGRGVGWLVGLMRNFSSCMSGKIFTRTPWPFIEQMFLNFGEFFLRGDSGGRLGGHSFVDWFTK